MNNVLEFIIFLSFQYALVQCLIPRLNVRRVDKTTIARKRQDTLDICRVFNEETTKHNYLDSPINIVKSYTPQRRGRNRFKRSALKYAVNPALNEEDEQRVEEIVDKLYDDVDDTVKTKYNKVNKNQPKQPSRRFDFAPQSLQGPVQVNEKSGTPQPVYYVSKARWKDGIIPYFIDPKTYDAQLAEQIMKAFDYVEKATCIRLQRIREKPVDEKSMKDVNWVYISNPTGIRQCVHSNENRRLDGVQLTVLGYDCMSQGDIVHEVMHILGYSHEHLRSDRDQFVSVLWDNIKPGATMFFAHIESEIYASTTCSRTLNSSKGIVGTERSLPGNLWMDKKLKKAKGYRKYFDINSVSENTYNLETLPYDYASILHYPSRAFSKNGKVTIMAEQGVKIGQREGFSEIDLQKVGLIYSTECVARNRQYLLRTCPSVVKTNIRPANISQSEITDYFKDRIWPYGVIPYKFRDEMEFSAEERENMRAVFRHIEKETCIRFRDITAEDKEEEREEEMKDDLTPLNQSNNSDDHVKNELNGVFPTDSNDIEPNFVVQNESSTNTSNKSTSHIPGKKIKMAQHLKKRRKHLNKELKPLTANRRHASASITLKRSVEPGCKCPESGRPQEDAVLLVNADCFNSVNDLLHYFVHILGLDHQHNMYDRDSYLHIVWDNLNDELKNELQNKLPPAASAGFAYDYQSVMHYPWLEIKDGKTNIMYPIWNDGWSMGHWQGLSSTDVQKLNLLYFEQCSKRPREETL